MSLASGSPSQQRLSQVEDLSRKCNSNETMKRRDSQKHGNVKQGNFVLAIPSAPLQEQVEVGNGNRKIAEGKRIMCEGRRTSFESLFGGLADEIADAKSATSSHIGTTLMLAQDDNFPIPYITVPRESRNSSQG